MQQQDASSLGAIAGGTIGAIVGDYPGMMIGMAMGGMLMGKLAGKNKPYNEDNKNTNQMTKLDRVPFVIGTDIAPGQLVWFGQLSLYDAAQLRGTEIYEEGLAYFSNYYRPLDSQFAVAFSSTLGEVGTFSSDYINTVFFDHKDEWHWCLWVGDAIKWDKNRKTGLLDAESPIELIKPTIYSWAFKDTLLTGIPHRFFTWMSYQGWFGDFSSMEMSGLDVAALAENPAYNFREAIKLQNFPDVSADVSSNRCVMSREAFSPVIGHYNTRHCSRDGMHEYYYSFENTALVDELWRVHPLYGKTLVFGGEDFFDYTLGHSHFMELSRTDEVLDRIYFFKGRLNLNPVGDWTLQRTSFANYSLAYDLFYIDRQTLLPHSLKLDAKISEGDFENGASTIQIRSMEITPDRILAFGWMTQDAFPVKHNVDITGVGNSGTRIYADLSGVPAGTFNDWFCWSMPGGSTHNYNKQSPPRRIVNQTTTYLDIDKNFGTLDADLIGLMLHISFAQTYDEEYITADLGSTTTMIICNCPVSLLGVGKDAGIHGGIEYNLEAGQFWSIWPAYSNYGTVYRINWDLTVIGGNIFLLDPLPQVPTPGTVFFVGNDGFYGGNQAPLDRELINPVIPTSMQMRYDEMLQMPWWWDNTSWNPIYGIPTNEGWRFPHVQAGCNNSNRMVCLQFSKTTGEYLGLLTGVSRYVRHIHAWGDEIQYTTAHESLIATCATDKEAFVHLACMQNSTDGAVNELIIDSQTFAIGQYIGDVDEWVSNPINNSRAYGSIFGGTAWVWFYDIVTEQYIKQWYAVRYNWLDSHPEFVRLNDGHFSNVTLVISRPVLWESALQVLWWRAGPTFNESLHIGKSGIENKLFIALNHAYDAMNFSFGGSQETWEFDPPSIQFPNGSFRCVSQSKEDWVYTDISYDDCIIPQWYFTSTLSSVIVGTFPATIGIGAFSYHCDENPISAIRALIKLNNDLGGYHNPTYFNSYSDYFWNTQVDSISYNAALVICEEAVTATMIYGQNEITFQEPRFRFSKALSDPQQLGTIIREIMQSCMGWMFPCGRKLKFVIPTPDETPVMYFGLERMSFVLSQNSYMGNEASVDNYLYIDLSDRPLNYLKGDLGYFLYNGTKYEFVVVAHTSTDRIRINWVVNGSSMMFVTLPVGLGIFIKKDNIKAGSFTYAQKSKYRRPNLVRIGFKNRLLGYVNDIAESQSDYLRQYDGYDKIETYDMTGIKRGTQAGRIAQRMMDYLEFVEWLCGFETDTMGIYLCPGDIIGVSHVITGWSGKWFRIMAMDETGNDMDTKFELEEYNPHVYHDDGAALLVPSGYNGFSPVTSDWSQFPLPVSKFSVIEDFNNSYLYIGFSLNTTQTNTIGGVVYRQNGDNWEEVGRLSGIPTTMHLGVALTDSKLDNSSLIYTNLSGTLPASGIVWIGSEQIYYNGVDSATGALKNLVRGYNDTLIGTHAVGDLVTVFSTASFIPIQESWIGSQTFKILPWIYSNVSVGVLLDAPSVTIDIVGYGYKPHFPESLRVVEQ